MAASYVSQSSIAIVDFPAAVGPQMMRSLSSAKTPLDLVPGEMNYRRASVHVVCWQSGVSQRREQRSHLTLRQLVTGFDRRLARDCCGETLVLGGRPCDAVSSQRIERFPQAFLGVEARMRHWNGIHNQSVPTETFDLEADPLEVIAIRIERLALCRSEEQRERQQESLCWGRAAFKGAHKLLVEDALMRRVLIDEDKSILVLERDIGTTKLKQRRYNLR